MTTIILMATSLLCGCLALTRRRNVDAQFCQKKGPEYKNASVRNSATVSTLANSPIRIQLDVETDLSAVIKAQETPGPGLVTD